MGGVKSKTYLILVLITLLFPYQDGWSVHLIITRVDNKEQPNCNDKCENINKRMKNKFGAKRSNLKIKSGKVVPFMIVFDKLPKNLDEYTVEVASSSI